MLEMPITYTNFDDEEVTETFYFNLTTAELVDLSLSKGEGFQDHLKAIMRSKDSAALIKTFQELVMMTVGRREGNRFVKTQQIRDEFATSEAYSEFLLKLVSDANAGANFINGVMPKKLRDQITKLSEDAPQQTVALPEAAEPLKEKTVEDYTTAQLLEMPQHEFNRLAGTNPAKMSHEVLQVAFQRRMKS